MQNLRPVLRLSHRVLVLDNSGEKQRLLPRIETCRTRHLARRLRAWVKTAIPATLREARRDYGQDIEP